MPGLINDGSAHSRTGSETTEDQGSKQYFVANTMKLNIDRATVRQLFRAVTKAADEIKEKSIIYGATKRVLPLQHMAQASEFMCRMVIRTTLPLRPMVTRISEHGPIGSW